MRTFAIGGALALALAVSGTARANLLVNGGLETTTRLNPSRMVFLASNRNPHALLGWTISSGTIDVVSTKVLKSSAGNFSVDLIGTAGLGGIQQTIQTTNGEHYTLTFDLSVNPTHRLRPFDEFGSTKILQVQAIGGQGGGNNQEDLHPAIGSGILASQSYTTTTGTRTRTNMQYSSQTFTFIGDGGPVTLVFSAMLPQNLGPRLTGALVRCGPMIDNLDLEIGGSASQVPEPASLGVLGLGGLLMLRRGSRKRV